VKIFAFIDHDIMLRHFYLNGALEDTLADPASRLVVPGAPMPKRISMSEDQIGGKTRLLIIPEHRRRRQVWARLFHVNRLRWRSGEQFAYLRNSTRRAIGKIHTAQYTLFALPGLYQLLGAYSNLVLRRRPNTNLVEKLKRERPDIVVHPTVMDGIYINDLLLACRQAKIPLVVIMNSWDNISTLRYLHHKPDWLLVWGQQTYEHALKYLGMPAERVIRFGSSQFDVYRHPARITAEEFRARNDLPDGRRIVLYAGSSKGLQEISHLDKLDAAIEAGKLGEAIILYRPHPWGDGGQGGEHLLDRKWKHVRIDSTMRAYLESVRAGFRGFFLSDYEDTRDVLTHIDCLVSPLSTIILEAALLGKPALCFLPMEEESMHFKRAAPLEHFQPMYDSPDFVIARAMDELVPGIIDMIRRSEDPETPSRMRKAASYFVDFFDAPYSERLASFLGDLLARRAR